MGEGEARREVIGVLAAVLLGMLSGKAEAASGDWLKLADNISVRPSSLKLDDTTCNVPGIQKDCHSLSVVVQMTRRDVETHQ